MKSRLLLGIACAALAQKAAAQAPVLMSPPWAAQACEAWNKEPELTGALFESGWVKNDAGRGFKVMQLYRRDCGEQPTAEMRIVAKEDKAICVFGGAVQTAKLDSGAERRHLSLARDGQGRLRSDAGNDAQPPALLGTEVRGHGQHGAIFSVPVAGGQGAGRRVALPAVSPGGVARAYEFGRGPWLD